ncbi:dihydroorotase [Thiolapillus brandeum]|uniref:Dihydroorotase n=1 Tax=Thiolapillus brandeum TaxID=1076588 RepID=A0A7U6GKT2_9GAMM|nr:dihydroorotase [Thiolapillus brandeum]BAO45506.1 dihydroorotase [Thiolapillus brandeum]
MNRIHIRGGRLIDPANAIDAERDLWLEHGKVLAVGEAPADFKPDQIIDARGKIVCPGLIDLGVHLREPGQEHKGTIGSEGRAAARGGITTLVCMPDTQPVIDTPAVWELIRRRAKACGNARVLAIGALTHELAGEQLAEMGALKRAGCVAVSNTRRPMANTLVTRHALEYASTFSLPVILCSEDPHLKAGGCVHEGAVASRLGLPGIPAAAETVAVARDLALTEHTGCRSHFHTLSTGRAIEMIRQARQGGAKLTAGVAIHQLFLMDQDVADFNTACHVDPPLRTQSDRDRLRQALRDGDIQVICSNHQPHEADAKTEPFPLTAPGISGLETLLPLSLKLVEEGLLDLATAIAALTSGPARVLDLPLGRLDPGRSADICIFDPEAIWKLDPETMASQGKNTPFAGWEFRGRVTHTLFEGRLTWSIDS